jgi:type I restriction enzyme S subunit
LSLYLRKAVAPDFGGISATDLLPLKPRAGVLDRHFLVWWLLSPQVLEYVTLRQTGVKMPRLRTGDLTKMPVPLPPLPEQRRIVARLEALLGEARTARQALERIPSLLARFRQAVLTAAFRGELTGNHRPLTTNGLPEGWERKTLPQLGELARGKSKHRPRDYERLYGGPYPFVQTGDIARAKGTVTTYSQTYSELGLAQSRLWPKGTLCITIAANIADTAILGFDACFPDSVVGFVADETVCDVRFVEFFIRTAKSDLEQFAPATAQKNINLGTLRKLAVPLPPLAEQHRIVARIQALFAQADTIEAAATAVLGRLPAVEQSILARAFRGELAPHDPDDEPALALLE